jgi:hypothetical protein
MCGVFGLLHVCKREASFVPLLPLEMGPPYLPPFLKISTMMSPGAPSSAIFDSPDPDPQQIAIDDVRKLMEDTADAKAYQASQTVF